jgi:hypothetical protein
MYTATTSSPRVASVTKVAPAPSSEIIAGGASSSPAKASVVVPSGPLWSARKAYTTCDPPSEAAARGDPGRAWATTVPSCAPRFVRCSAPARSMQNSAAPAAAQPGVVARSAGSPSVRRSGGFGSGGLPPFGGGGAGTTFGKVTARGRPSRLKTTCGSAWAASSNQSAACPVNGSCTGPRVTRHASPAASGGSDGAADATPRAAEDVAVTAGAAADPAGAAEATCVPGGARTAAPGGSRRRRSRSGSLQDTSVTRRSAAPPATPPPTREPSRSSGETR